MDRAFTGCLKISFEFHYIMIILFVIIVKILIYKPSYNTYNK